MSGPNPNRIPGEKNPGLDRSRAAQIQNAHNASAGMGSGDFGLGRLVAWLLGRRKRRG